MTRQHTNQQDWHRTWLWFGISVLILPMFPAMGALGLFVLSIKIWQLNYRQIIASRLNLGLGVLAIFLIVSSVVAEQKNEAWLGLANFLPFFWLFTAVRELIGKPIQLRQLSWVLVLPSLPIVFLGYGQLFAGWDTPPWVESIIGWGLTPYGVPPGRMSAVFIYTNFLAIYLAIAFALALGLWLDTWQAWRQKSTKHHTQVWLLLTIVLLADISGLVLTSSRNAWGLAVISFMAYALYIGWRWLVWGIMGGATVILWASFAPSFGGTQLRKVVPAFFWERLSDTTYIRPVETLRISQWQFCWDLIKQRPWFGWGLRNFSPLYEAKMNYWFGHPHSLLLMLGAEIGIIATLILVAIVGSIMYRTSKRFVYWRDLPTIKGISEDVLKDAPANKNLARMYGITSLGDSKLIYFSYLVAFFNCILFNLLDVTIFDLRVNTINWILLAAINGIIIAESNENNIS